MVITNWKILVKILTDAYIMFSCDMMEPVYSCHENAILKLLATPGHLVDTRSESLG